MSARFQAICFDLDGVLIDTMALHATAWQHALALRGLRVRRREIYEWEGEPGSVTATRLLRRGRRRASPQACRSLLRDKEHHFSALAGAVGVKPIWMRLLDWLRDRQLRLGLVTGTSRAEVRRVVSSSVLRRFRVVITGDVVGRGKPHPDPYRLAFTRLHASPQRTVVIENAPYGIQSARRANAGFIVGLSSSLPAACLHQADLVVRHPRQLRIVLRNIL